MISFKASKTLGFVLASAGILLNAHSALAADVLGDAQMQAGDLLSGTIGARSKAVQVAAAIPVDDARALNVEPQEQARRLILGKPSGDRVGARVNGSDLEMASVREERRAQADPQGAARRMLLAAGA
jgi:hypothetical protein